MMCNSYITCHVPFRVFRYEYKVIQEHNTSTDLIIMNVLICILALKTDFKVIKFM